MKRYLAVLLMTIILWLMAPLSPTLAAQFQSQERFVSYQSGDVPIDPAELETFLDQVIHEQMEEDHIAGAAVSVVQNGEMIFAKGYGLADVEANKPVDPETTLFLIGSISKIFTDTAVMQLVEQGKLDLNADVNTYLDFKIPDTYPEPITLTDLMTHSSGFDEVFWGTAATGPESILPLGEYVRTYLPARVRPPGIVEAYSNYGISLVGYIVERVSGQPYADYVKEHIIQPLGMSRTIPGAILPDSLAPDLSLPYVYLDGSFQTDQDAMMYLHSTPSGSYRSTATDMARFMIAHLEGGAYQNARILNPETVELMHTQNFTADPRILGWAHGFEVLRAENPRVIGHGGATDNFFVKMWLVPAAHLGIFIADNTFSGRPMTEQVAAAFIERYFPAPTTPPVMMTGSTTDLHALEGDYASTNVSMATAEKAKLMASTLTVKAQDDGSLIVSSLAGSQRYVEVAPMLFQRDDGKRVDYSDQLTFKTGTDGRIQYMLFSLCGFQKLPWYESMTFTLLLAATVTLFFLSIPIVAIIWRVSRHLRSQASQQPKETRWARWTMGLLVIIFFLSQAGLFSAFADQDAYLMGIAYANQVGRWLAIPFSLLAVGVVLFTILAWWRGYWGLGWRIHYTLVTLAAMAQVWSYFDWKVIV